MFKILIFLLLVLNSTLSYSHSQLIEILPKDNVIYTKTPPQIQLKFRSKVKLVKVDLNKIAEDNQKIKLDLTSFKESSNEFAIPMPSITSGKYNILWRALSPDGHIIKGKSEFEVK